LPIHLRESFDTAWNILQDEKVQAIIYKSQAPRDRFNMFLIEADKDEFYQEYWSPVAELLEQTGKTHVLLKKLFVGLLI
jgi:hypothetical protein